MFSLFSPSTIALVVFYFLGVVQTGRAAHHAGKSWGAIAGYSFTWPVSLWKVSKDLWKSPPPLS